MRLYRWAGIAMLALSLWPALSSSAAEWPLLAFLRPMPQAASAEEESEPAPAQPETHEARKALGGPGFYDLTNPDYVHLQKHDDAVKKLPKDSIGFPDWMRALNERSIQPRAGLGPNDAMNVLNLDIIMRNTKEMPNVRFPHYSHTLWLDCSNCHPTPFEPRAGSTQITMADIFRGKYCGMCHDRVAFITFFSCSRCHSVPQTPPASTAQPATR